MIENLLYLGSGFLLSVCLFLAFAALRTYRSAKQDREKIEWVYNQIKRALAQIESEDENEILAGLQTIAMLSEPTIRFKALSRLTELAQSDNPLIKNYAKVAIQKLINSPKM